MTAMFQSYFQLKQNTGFSYLDFQMDPLRYKKIVGIFNEHHHWMLTVEVWPL